VAHLENGGIANSEERSLVDRSIITGTLWGHAAFGSSKLIALAYTAVLARLIVPEDFGQVAVGLVILAYMESLSELGASSFVIWSRDTVSRTAAAAMTTTLVAAACAALGLYFLAAPVALLFGSSDSRVFIQVLSVAFLLSGPASVFSGILVRRLEFKSLLVSDVARTTIKAAVGISTAVAGWEAWSIVAGHLSGVMAGLICSCYFARWRPRLSFDGMLIKRSISYGSHIAAANLLGAAVSNLDYAVVGHFFGPASLGVYVLAFTLVEQCVLAVCWALSQALFPNLSAIQGERGRIIDAYGACLRGVTMLVFPMSVGLALVSKPLILSLFGPEWKDAIVLVRLFAFYALVYSMAFNLGDLYKAIGRPHILSYMSLVSLAVAIPAFIISTRWGVAGVAAAQIVVAVCVAVVNWGVAIRILQIGPKLLIRSATPALFATTAMTIGCLFVYFQTMALHPLVQLVSVTGTGLVIYAAAAWFIVPGLLVGAWTTLIARGSKQEPRGL
jgi:lipopolysaccharide exporter